MPQSMGLYLWLRNCSSSTPYAFFDMKRPAPQHLGTPFTAMYNNNSGSALLSAREFIVDFAKKHIWSAIKVKFSNTAKFVQCFTIL